MTRALLAAIVACAFGLPVWADTISIGGTMVTITEAQSPVVAVIEMKNRLVNGPSDEREYVLTLPSLDVPARFDWDASGQDDELIVTPPDGTYCEPRSCVLRVEENGTGTLRLMEWVGG